MLKPNVYKNILVSSFDSKGLLVYVLKEGSNNYWDIFSYPNYLDPDDEDDRSSSRRKNKRKSIKQRYDEGNPTVGPLREPLGKFEYLVNYTAPKR